MAISNIQKTKFYAPVTPSDFVERVRLKKKFDKLEYTPILLVTASAGYGKSLTVASQMKNKNFSWLSLGKRDNDFRKFIKYFILSIQEKEPDFGQYILDLLSVSELPSVLELAEIFTNETLKFDTPIHLVLDDYHLISNKEIDDFLKRIFEFPSPSFKLIIISRRDPALPLSIWRAKGLLTEIRLSDLLFRKDETLEFCSNNLDRKPDENFVKRMGEMSEGWVSGLRLLMLSYNSTKNLKQTPTLRLEKSDEITQLIQDILDGVSEETKDNLLKLSVVAEFNQGLFNAICDVSEDEVFQETIARLVNSNLFIIPLDKKGQWFRFHHFFKDEMEKAFLQNYKIEVINQSKRRAAEWFYSQNMIFEAIMSFIQCDNTERALNLFIPYRVELIAASRFQELVTIYSLFPEEFRDENIYLRMTRVWLFFFESDIKSMSESLSTMEELIASSDLTDEQKRTLLGEALALKAYDYYLCNIDTKLSKDCSEKAIELLHGANPYAYGLAWIFYGATMQLLGQAEEAKNQIVKLLGSSDKTSFSSQLLLIHFYIEWYEADMAGAKKTALSLIEHGYDIEDNMAIAHGHCLLAMSLYYLGDFKGLMELKNNLIHFRLFALKALSIAPLQVLAKVYALTNCETESKELLLLTRNMIKETDSHRHFRIIEANEADIFASNNEYEAVRWAKTFDYKDYLPLVDLYSPEFTQARILVKHGDEESLEVAQKILDQMSGFYGPRNNSMMRVQLCLLSSLLWFKKGKKAIAERELKSALKAALSKSIPQPFREMGDEIIEMMIAFRDNDIYPALITYILPDYLKAQKSTYVLSNREKEILRLSNEMTNKEVANLLFISEKTVKTHITNINKKLDTPSKQESLAKAKQNGLLD